MPQAHIVSRFLSEDIAFSLFLSNIMTYSKLKRYLARYETLLGLQTNIKSGNYHANRLRISKKPSGHRKA